MKKACLVLNLALGLVAAMPAQASLLPMPMPVYDSLIMRFNVDPKLPWSNAVQNGKVELNFMTNEAVLVIERKAPCSPTFCEGVAKPVVVRLPIMTVGQPTTCGSRDITAVLDQRNQGRDIKVLKITDNARNHCPTFAALPATEITLDTAASREGMKTHSTFVGERLRKVSDQQ